MEVRLSPAPGRRRTRGPGDALVPCAAPTSASDLVGSLARAPVSSDARRRVVSVLGPAAAPPPSGRRALPLRRPTDDRGPEPGAEAPPAPPTRGRGFRPRGYRRRGPSWTLPFASLAYAGLEGGSEEEDSLRVGAKTGQGGEWTSAPARALAGA